MQAIVTMAGAVLATLAGVVIGSILTNRSQSRQWSRDRLADACLQVLRESSNAMIELGVLSGQGIECAPDGTRVPSTMDWRPWNEALAVLSLVATGEIAEKAYAIDAELWPAHQVIKRGWITYADWREFRDVIDARRRDFVNAARRQLASPGSPLHRITGRPAADDPFWQLRRSYFSADDNQEVSIHASVVRPEKEGASIKETAPSSNS